MRPVITAVLSRAPVAAANGAPAATDALSMPPAARTALPTKAEATALPVKASVADAAVADTHVTAVWKAATTTGITCGTKTPSALLATLL
jgi:hypothetical protein